jgi:hypothetical protein
VSTDSAADPDRSDEGDESAPSPAANFLAVLNVRRNALLGAGAGVALAAAVYLYFVAIPLLRPDVPVRDRSPLLFLSLAFVVAVTTAMLVATVLTTVTAVRRTWELK